LNGVVQVISPARRFFFRRGGFFGKPLRVIFRFRHQDAQNPPLLPQGEKGAGGMRGQKRTGMQKIIHPSQEIS
jgi:hypothetical protein